MPLKIVCDALQAHRSVKSAANELRCSQAYIFKVLKENGLKLKDVIKKEGQGVSNDKER
jgi:hypothetical protein